MKTTISKLLRAIGLKISRAEFSPYEYLLAQPRYKETTVNLLGRPFRVADGHSFYWSHREIFGSEIYKFLSSTDAPVIIDCGANYGTSILYFKQLYPAARIIAIEPDPKIFELLKSNVTEHELAEVTLVDKAISNHKEKLRFFHEGADGGRTHLLSDAKQTFEVEPVKLDSLLSTRIDFLKMDIEGAETEAICSSEKLGNVAQIFIEYHSFVDTPQALDALLRKLSGEGFRYYIQSQFCPPQPLLSRECQLGMDLQLNIFAVR